MMSDANYGSTVTCTFQTMFTDFSFETTDVTVKRHSVWLLNFTANKMSTSTSECRAPQVCRHT